MSKQRFTPPPARPSVVAPDSAAARSFVHGAERRDDAPSPANVPRPSPAAKNAIAWKDLDDKMRPFGGIFNMRFTKLEKTCLQYIDKKTPFSQHSFILSVLRPALADKIKELTGEDLSALLANPDED